jgi:Winged helix DNA-binding domain
MAAPLVATRLQILAFRRRAGALDERLAGGAESLRAAAWAGLQDSMPRAAVLSIHARVEDVRSSVLDDPSLVQLWGPRYQVYVIAACDLPVFSLGRLPDDEKGRRRAEDAAARLHAHLQGARTGYARAGEAMGVHAGSFRYGATTGTILIRWEGARQPAVWTVPRPETDPREARRELARRYLHVFGPSTAAGFAKWAGVSAKAAATTFESLHDALTAVRTPIGDAWILSSDEPALRAPSARPAPVRLLPSGDAYFLLWDAERSLLVPDAARRSELWTPRVWPGALVLDGEVRGVWRRAHDTLTIQTWGRLSAATRAAVEAEAASLPLPGLERAIVVRWDG